jgi:TIR domain
VKIFISYSREDAVIADALAVGLRQDHHEVFFDRDDLAVGEEYHARIRHDIDACDLFIFLITPGSVRPTSYTLTELAIARQRWPDPSGHVLPVLAKSTSDPDIPPYLAAVTYLQGTGNLVAEALAAVAKVAQERHRKASVRIGVGAAALLALLVGGVGYSRSPRDIWPKPCYLSATVATDSATAVLPNGLTLDVTNQGTTSSFVVSPEGSATIDVGSLAAADAPWAFELRSATLDSVSRQPIRGCPTAASTYALLGGLNVTLVPR